MNPSTPESSTEANGTLKPFNPNQQPATTTSNKKGEKMAFASLLCVLTCILAMLGGVVVVAAEVATWIEDRPALCRAEARELISVAATLQGSEVAREIGAAVRVLQFCYKQGCDTTELFPLVEEIDSLHREWRFLQSHSRVLPYRWDDLAYC